MLEATATECVYYTKNEQVQLRHIEGKGVGYDQGYTTIQLFFAPLFEKFVPLFDFRGHVFDDGNFAANAGVGLRYKGERIWGASAYYDYRQTDHFHYNQVALDLETLGSLVDFRLNGYLPVGRKERSFYKHHAQKEEFAMTGANAEIGLHLYETDFVKLYSAFGPYYFERKGKNAWGGEARLAATFSEHVRVEVNTSYDPVFKWIGQGQLSLMFFFGPRIKVAKTPQQNCLDALKMRKRATQWIARDEIIVVDTKSS